MCRERQRVSVAAVTTVLNVMSYPKPIRVSGRGVDARPDSAARPVAEKANQPQ
jgi:hypothetical protein